MGFTVQKMNFSIKDFFIRCDQIRKKLKKYLMKKFIFCAVVVRYLVETWFIPKYFVLTKTRMKEG